MTDETDLREQHRLMVSTAQRYASIAAGLAERAGQIARRLEIEVGDCPFMREHDVSPSGRWLSGWVGNKEHKTDE